MKKRVLLLVLIGLSKTVIASSFLSGNQLYQNLESTVLIEKAYGLGYILGVMDTKFYNCRLNNVTGGQLADSVKIYLQNNPEIRHYNASNLVEKIVREKYGCKN